MHAGFCKVGHMSSKSSCVPSAQTREASLTAQLEMRTEKNCDFITKSVRLFINETPLILSDATTTVTLPYKGGISLGQCALFVCIECGSSWKCNFRTKSLHEKSELEFKIIVITRLSQWEVINGRICRTEGFLPWRPLSRLSRTACRQTSKVCHDCGR